MKNIFHTLRIMSMAAMVLPLTTTMISCGDDDDETPVLQFPETQVLNCTAGETRTVEFDTEADWKLTSTKSWCKFVQDGGTELSASGKAGHQQVKLVISDEGLTQGDGHRAQLTLYMQGQSGVLAEITRSAAGYELKVFDAKGNELTDGQPVQVGYSTYAEFQVEANFAFAVTAMPDWVELQGGSMRGAANKRTVGAIRVVPNGTVEKKEQTGTILFQDLKGLASFCINIAFAGMDRNVISISHPGSNSWNWKVSADGTTWTHETSTYDRFVPCSISAYNDDYEIVCIEDIDGKLSVGCDWVHFNKEKGRLTADATTEARKAYVLAFPREVYEEIKGNLAATLIEEENGKEQIVHIYEQDNLVAHVVQEVPTNSGDSDENAGFIALCFDENWEAVWIRCNRVTDTALVDRCEELTGCRELYLLDTPSPRGHFDQIRPWPIISDNAGLSGESAYFMDKDGTHLEDETPELSFCDSEAPSFWYIMGCHNTDEPMYLVLTDADAKVVTKVLMINTNGNRK